MALSEAEWARLHTALLAAIRAHDVRLEESAAEYSAAIRVALRDAGLTMSPAAEQYVTDYLDAAEALVREGIGAAVASVADLAAPAMRSALVAERTAAAYAERWPDGLRLSQRVWAWGEATRRGVSDALAAGVRTERATNAVVMDMQRAIEAASGERFAIAERAREDWADRLRRAARGSIKTPGAMDHWVQTVADAEAHVASLRDGGTRRQAAHALASIRTAVADGRLDLLDKHLEWWLYDRQLYSLRRIARTEMATAGHQAVLAVGDADPDVQGYTWELSASHPVPDICDYYADVDFGMGAGVWPKDQVPRHKAHPHCMCAITPTTRKMRRDGKRGATDVATFMERLPAATRATLEPRWAQDLQAAGVPTARLLREDGRWFATREQVQAALGAERMAAAQAIGAALARPDWGQARVRVGSRQGRETVAAARAHTEDPAAARLLAQIAQAGDARPQLDGRDLHYLRRRYVDGVALGAPEDLDERAALVLRDPAARLFEQRLGDERRWALYSEATGWTVIVAPTGRRVSPFPQTDTPTDLGNERWTKADLHR